MRDNKTSLITIVTFYLLVNADSCLSYTASESETVGLVYGDEQMVSIATGNYQLLYKAPAVASVITRQQIAESSATNLNELLEMVPGLHVSRDYLSGDAIYSMRGFFRDPDAGVLLLFNGVPLNNLQKGSRFSALQMPLENIDQIEVIRGPGSAVYGADAFVGTINIVTKNITSADDVSAGIRLGSFSNKHLWFQDILKLPGWSLSYMLELQSDKGDDGRVVEADLQSYLDVQALTNASAAPGSISSEYNVLNMLFDVSYQDWKLQQWIWLNTDQGNGHGLPGIDTLDPEGGIDSRVFLSSVEYNNHNFSHDWSLNGRFSYLHNQSRQLQYLLPAGSNAPIGDDGNLFTPGTRSVFFTSGMIDSTDIRENHLNLELTAFYRAFRQHQIRLSSGYQYQTYDANESRNFGPGVLDAGQSVAQSQLTDVSSDSLVFLPSNTRKISHLSVQDEWDFTTDWSLTTGIRYDQYSDFGNTINPRLALVWQTRHDLTTKFLYGRAFRAPTYMELYLQNRPGTDGNPALQPEVIDTLELAFDYRPSSEFRTTLSLFDYRAQDLIFSVDSITAANTKTLENSETQDGYGIEFDFHWRLNDQFKIYSNFAWQFSTLFGTDQQPALAPQRQAFVDLKWSFAPYWQFIPQVHWIDYGPREVGDSREELASQLQLDARLRYRNHYKNWEFSVIARNLLNEDLFEPSLANTSISGGAAIENDIPMPGAAIYLELRIFPATGF